METPTVTKEDASNVAGGCGIAGFYNILPLCNFVLLGEGGGDPM